MNKMKNQKNNDMLDLLKFIAAICVVAIHSLQYNALGNNLRVFTRFSVPFFFLVSSYFLFNKLSFKDHKKDNERIKKYCYRIIKLYFCWLIVYLPFLFKIIRKIVEGDHTKKEGLLFIYKILLGYVPSIGVTWYLIATIISVLITYFVRYYWGEKFLIVIACISFIIGITTSTYGEWYFEIEWLKHLPLSGVISFSFISTICYVILGYFLSEMNIENKISNLVLSIGIILFSSLGFLETKMAQAFGSYHDGQNYIFLPLITICIFLLGINSSSRKIFGAPFLRQSSTIIFLAQNPVKYVLFNLGNRLHIPKLTFDNFYVFVLQLLVLIAGSFVLIQLSKRRTFKWLKNMY